MSSSVMPSTMTTFGSLNSSSLLNASFLASSGVRASTTMISSVALRAGTFPMALLNVFSYVALEIAKFILTFTKGVDVEEISSVSLTSGTGSLA